MQTACTVSDPGGPVPPAQAPPPFFTVLINAYNGEDFIGTAIDSVLAQDFDDYELLVWDDASTDRTAEIVASYDDPRIRLVRAAVRVPIGPAREAACREARGQWIAFLDQDDIWLPGKLRRQHAAIRAGSPRLGLVYGRTIQFGAARSDAEFDPWHRIGRQPEGDVFRALLRRPSFIALSSGCIRREAFEALGGIPPEVVYCPDYFLFVRVARDWEAACIQQAVCRYRVHAASMSHVYTAQIHAEALRIVRDAARPVDADIVRYRTRIAHTLLASERMRGGDWRGGIAELIGQGSLPYFLIRPLLRGVWRPLRRKLENHVEPDMKYKLMGLVRRLGLLPLADKLRFAQRRLQVAQSNRRFLAANPGYVLPPEHLAFDAYNNVDWAGYDRVGRVQARVFADAIAAHAPAGPVAVLEWGCGPGRLIRHLPELLGDRLGRLAGSDYNPETIAWCRANLPGTEFAENALMPPLAFPDASFDAVYNFSVFTHLSEAAHLAWAAELKRVLKPGGILLSTTHGDAYRYLLSTEAERTRYEAGEIVTQDGYEEGKKLYFAIHPPRFVTGRLLAGFDDVRSLAVDAASGMLQTLWLARRPALQAEALPA